MATTANAWLATLLLRLVYPIVLIAGTVFRPSGISFLYLVLFLYLPFVPVPTKISLRGHTGRYLKCCLLIAFLTVTSQMIFQIILVALTPYGGFLATCELTEKLLRQFGLVRLNALNWVQLIRWLGPDCAMLVGTLVTYLVINNILDTGGSAPLSPLPGSAPTPAIPSRPKRPGKGSRLLALVGPYAVLASLCITSSLEPSIPSSFYYLVFLLGATWWAMGQSIRTRFFAVLFALVSMFVLVHVTGIYFYQFELAQELLAAQSLEARLLGLVPLLLTNCTGDPRISIFNPELSWNSFVSPLCLMAMFHLLIYEIKTLLKPQLLAYAPARRRYSSAGRQYSSEDGVGMAPDLQETSLGGRDSAVNMNPRVLTRGVSVMSRDSGRVASSLSPNDAQEQEYDGYGLLLAGLFTLFDLFAKSSYVATNIIMMAWSITYHSWLTFVLLLWACVLWMFPNQRRAMLVSSPGLVIYAEFLLLAQYIFSLNLTDEELPQQVDGIDLGQVGLVKPVTNAYLPILVKSLYTCMFWITLKQFVMELKEKKATIQNAAQEPFRITVSTAGGSTGPVSELKAGRTGPARPTYMMKIGTFVQDIMTKFWIWVVAIMLFVIGLGGDKVVLYRIVYMALFLIFILTFQLSYRVWRKMMYGFWLTVIVYSMLVLVMIYTYQFKNIPEYLSNYTGIPTQLQTDIGLEIYDTSSLFVRLLTPTFFVVITVVQLHYFHKDFLKLSEMSKPQERKKSVSPIPSTDEEPPPLIDDFTFANLLKNVTYYGVIVFEHSLKVYALVSEIGWRFLEIHIMKIVLFSAYMLSVYDSCAIHFVLFVGVICAMAVTSVRIQRLITHICSIYISGLLLTKMIYQIDYINHEQWTTNCTVGGENVTRNDAVWVGLTKTNHLSSLLTGYVGMILVLTVQAVVHIRQRYQRYMTRMLEPVVGILFPKITRYDADKSILDCVKFLLNYGFYKFGVEITLVTMVVVIGTRLDAFSVLYSFWLIPMFLMSRVRLGRIWLPFIAFVTVLLPIQYMSCVGLPPFICPEYPWESWPYFNLVELKQWLFLPDILVPPKATRLIPDFFLLLFACQQQAVFWIEKNIRQDDFPGGSNQELSEMYIPPSENPTPDFLMATKTWLDVIKKCVFLSFYWITLAIIFLTGTNRVNLFALGYLVGSFIFLWEGNEFYLRSKREIISRWNYLIAFNVFVVFSKSILQLVGCVFSASTSCWVVQLLGIACLKFAGDTTSASSDTCPAPQGEAGLMWDGITFGFLLFQRKIFNSYYFFHIRSETEAQAQLASRGAELIGELMQKQIKQQEEQEKDVLEKIKTKMDRIKATHQKGRPKEILNNHFDASSMVSSVSMDEAPIIEPDPPPSPRAPLAVQISTVITSGSGPTPTPSSAAMTLSVDGFFEPPYGRAYDQRYALLQPPPLPLSPSDESFPVFSPPPYDHATMGRERMTTAGVQTSPQQYRHFITTLNSPALSHHTSIRSGDYYMFDEYDDEEDLEMIDSITEEEDESELGKPSGMTITELMASALKTGDVESAAEMARLARRGSDARGDGSLTESMATSSVAVPRRRMSSRRRLSRKSHSFRSDRQRLPPAAPAPERSDSDYVAPLAISDEETSRLTGAGDTLGGGEGGDGGGDYPGPSSLESVPVQDEPPPPVPPPAPTFMRRVLAYLRFGWAFLESMMVSLTAYLNKFSRDYRHVSRCLAEEKQELKEKELTQPPIFAVHSGHSADRLESGIRRQDSVELGEDASAQERHTGIDLTKQVSTEESDLGGSGDAGSKDDLQTVVMKPSPIRERDGIDEKVSSASLDEVLSSPGSETTYPPIVHLVVAIWYVIISHSDLVCYFVVFLNQMKSASILSLPLPLMVLLWGSLSVPRPTKTFWVTIIAYTEAIVVIKYLFQFDFFPWNDPSLPEKKDPFTPQKILGIEKHGKYAVYDVTLLMVVFFHRYMLKSLGLWKNKSMSGQETSIVVSVEQYPVAKTRPSKMNGNGDEFHDALLEPLEDDGTGDKEESSGSEEGCIPPWDDWQLGESLAYAPTIFKLCILQYLSSIKTFFDQILNLEYKVKVDVYSYMFICDFFNFLVLIFGFSAFGSQQNDVTSYLEENKVPVPFLVMVILQFALIVIDRALYLRKYIMGKFFYQMFLVTFIHIAMFFILPAVTEREFKARIPPQMWYMVKCIYLLFSAYQIRSGYPTRILGNFLCKKYNYVNMFLFKGFMAVPFLFELRALMDWIWTDTSMTLSDWLKLEDIFAHVFQLKCQRRVEKEYPQGRGMPKARWSKYAIGGSSLFIIIAIIWFPLVLFALGNTVGLPNRPKELQIELSIGSFQPIFTMTAQNNSLKNFSSSEYNALNSVFRGDKDALYFISGYESDDISVAQFDGNSDAVWGISPPSKDKLLLELQSNESVSIRFSYMVQRSTPNPNLGDTVKEMKEVPLEPGTKIRKQLIEMINGTAGNDSEVKIDSIFPKFLKITNTGKAQIPGQLNTKVTGGPKGYNLRSLKLKLMGAPDLHANERWWDVEEECDEVRYSDVSDPLPLDDHCTKDHLNMYTFNEKSFPPTLSLISGGGIIGLYTTLVLVASKFVRSFFAGISFLIMFDDMPNVDRLFQLCLDIYLVRESNELALEEDLFAKMIFLYRSPETLIKWTRPKTTPPELPAIVPA